MEIRQCDVGGQTLRVGIRRGGGARPALLLFNGIGASIELAEPFVEALQGPDVIIFDVPGVGGSPAPRFPYRPWTLTQLSAQLLDQLGYEQVDVLGVSWGGLLAQQFAFQKHADAPSGLLRPPGARPGDGHAAKKGDEFAPLHGLPQNTREQSLSLCDRAASEKWHATDRRC